MAFGDVNITIIGNLGRDPEVRYTPGGKAVAKFRVVVNTRVRGADGSWTDGEPNSYQVTAWEQMAENIGESLKRGDRVVVTGSWRQRSYEVEGDTRYAWELTAEAVGPDLRYATAKVQKMTRSSQARPVDFTNAPAEDAWTTPATTQG